MKKSVLHHFYRDLTGDSAVSSSESEKDVYEKLSALFELEEPDLMYDLRVANQRNKSNRYSVFWNKAKEFFGGRCWYCCRRKTAHSGCSCCKSYFCAQL